MIRYTAGMPQKITSKSGGTTIAIRAEESREILLHDRHDGLVESWERYLLSCVERSEMSAMTADSYRKSVRRLWEWASEQGEYVTLDAEALLRWKAQLLKTVKPASANLYIAGVRAFYAWATSRGVVKVNPASALKSVKRVGIRQRHSRGWLTESEAAELLATEMEPRDKAIIALMLFTGARGIELLRADLADLQCHGEACVLYVVGKGRSISDREPLLITADAMQYLASWLKERGPSSGPLFTSFSRRSRAARLASSSLRQIVKAALAKAGITRPGISTHSLRHTAATTLLKNGGNVRDAQTLLRHSSIETTMIYAHEVDRMARPPERFISYSKKPEVVMA